MTSRKVKHVVADSGAFIRNAPLNSIGEEIYIVPEVTQEIRDKATRRRLEVLPYKLIPKTPSPECIKIVTEFAKKTGDYRSLSAVDIKVLALTYQLEKENVGTNHIQTTPNRNIEWHTTRQVLDKPTDIAGFYLSKKTTSRTTSECTSTSDLCEQPFTNTEESVIETTEVNNAEISEKTENLRESEMGGEVIDSDTRLKDTESKNNMKASSICTDMVDSDNKVADGRNSKENCMGVEEENFSADENASQSQRRLYGEGAVMPSSVLEEEEETDEDEGIEEDEDEDDDDDDDGWITPSNIQSVKESMGEPNMEKASVTVGCVTTDFAMQNVLIQMGLNVISVDGMLIKRAKSHVLRCFACMKITKDMMKAFCPHCGNNTLQKVSMTLEEDGSVRCFLSRRRPVNIRGLKYSLPMPKGGKHAQNPVLVADQPRPQQRVSKKARQKMDVFDPDFVANQSPFSVHDITSRAAQLGIKGNNQFNRRNPNENRRRGGKRK